MRPQATNISKTIQDFNRECAEQRKRRTITAPRKAQKRIQNYGVDMGVVLGQGTFSKVFLGREVNDETQVAVKVVELRRIIEMGIEDLFWQEISIVRKLKHPNVVSCLEYFKTTNNCYTIYEFCEGGDLATRLKKGHLGDREDLVQANAIIRDVFQGLLYLESMSIVHRDIKAANILLAGGRAKIGDFGFATHCKHEFTDVSIGSPAYMAPEGLLHNVYGPKTDVWSFGMLLFEILHGRTPFHNCQSEGELKQRVQVPVNWDQLRGNLPSPLKRLVLKCLKVDYAQRPTFSELMKDEYLMKIFNEEGSNRHFCKSNDTKLTSDSEALNRHMTAGKNGRRSISPFYFKQQRLTIEDDDEDRNEPQKTVHTEPNETDEVINSSPLSQDQQISISELMELADKVSLQTQPEVEPPLGLKLLKEANIARFILLTQQSYSLEGLQAYLKMASIFQETIVLIQRSSTQRPYQLLLEIYTKSNHYQFIDLIQQIQHSESLLSCFSNQRNLITESSQLPFKLIEEQLFALIKQAETEIDWQDIQGRSHQPQNELIYKGCLLIVAIRLVYGLQGYGQYDQWLQNHSCNLRSSQQFFMWLYQLQLARMDRQDSN